MTRALADAQIEAVRRLARPEQVQNADGSWPNEDCLDCGDELGARLKLGKVRCVTCQGRRERQAFVAKVNPNSKASRIKRAKASLEALLRAPKTQAGLIAAAKTKGVSRNFVYGWLTNAVRTGEVVKHKSSDPLTYQLASLAAAELPCAGTYPIVA